MSNLHGKTLAVSLLFSEHDYESHQRDHQHLSLSPKAWSGSFASQLKAMMCDGPDGSTRVSFSELGREP